MLCEPSLPLISEHDVSVQRSQHPGVGQMLLAEDALQLPALILHYVEELAAVLYNQTVAQCPAGSAHPEESQPHPNSQSSPSPCARPHPNAIGRPLQPGIARPARERRAPDTPAGEVLWLVV